ncbi:dUTP diphosphatase [Candidatus Uhrbacteria bacterium]|nr:dUTP diphosphatase [Candidatus Uhrbacteria bacterium]
MQVRITRLDPSVPLPRYHTNGSVAFDLSSRMDMTVPSRTTARVPTGLVIATPPGYALIITLRSSTPERKGLLMPHGTGLSDQDFCGPHDELHLLVYNFTDAPVTITKGERIGQGFFTPIEKVIWEEGMPQATISRGGFGSTGP